MMLRRAQRQPAIRMAFAVSLMMAGGCATAAPGSLSPGTAATRAPVQHSLTPFDCLVLASLVDSPHLLGVSGYLTAAMGRVTQGHTAQGHSAVQGRVRPEGT